MTVQDVPQGHLIRFFHGEEIVRLLHHAEERGVALLVGADAAGVQIGQVAALRAGADPFVQVAYGLREGADVFGFTLQ